jgi:hypothetical protein
MAAPTTTIAAFVAMTLAQGRQPARIRSTGTRCWMKKTKAGRSPNLRQGVTVHAVERAPDGAHGAVLPRR